jgi:hypothetical protein
VKAPSAGVGLRWNWDNTATYGLGFRLSDPDQRLIGLAAGGTAYSVNGDDGIQNYATGIFTNTPKLTSELEWSYKSIGGFVRVFGLYDFENESKDRARTPLSSDAKDRVGARAELRDAFLYGRFELGSSPVPGEHGRRAGPAAGPAALPARARTP